MTFSSKADVIGGEKQPGVAKITMSGPAGAWFGVGFNATAMADQPYTLAPPKQNTFYFRELSGLFKDRSHPYIYCNYMVHGS